MSLNVFSQQWKIYHSCNPLINFFLHVPPLHFNSTRDHTRQTRIVRCNSEKMEIYTVNHHKRDEEDQAEIRFDASIDLLGGEMKLMLDNEAYDRDNWFSAFLPENQDG